MATFKTKYKVGDCIWAIVDNKAKNLCISEIRVVISSKVKTEYLCYYSTLGCYTPTGTTVVPCMTDRHEYVLTEEKMFKTKKALIKSL